MRKFVFPLLLASFVVATCAVLSAQDSEEFTVESARDKDSAVPAQEPIASCQDCSDGEFVSVDLSDPDKVKAKKAFDEARQFFLDGEYKKVKTQIETALKLDPKNDTYKAWKEHIDKFTKGGVAPPTPTTTSNGGASTFGGLPIDYRASNGAEYRLIKVGSFTMGSEDEYDAKPHKVTLTQDFYLGKYPVTRGEFKSFVEATGYKTTAEKEGSAITLLKDGGIEYVDGISWKNPGFEQTDCHPVVSVSYDDALAYVAWLNKSSNPEDDFNGLKPTYRLPTEAEWEYSCRAGTKTKFFWGDDEKDGKGCLNAFGMENNPEEEYWIFCFPFDDGYSATSPVGSFKPNPWGLYDMSGEVLEWTSDWYDDYPNGSVTDPKGATSGSSRVLRGGGWISCPWGCRSASRSSDKPWGRDTYYGLRVAFSLTK